MYVTNAEKKTYKRDGPNGKWEEVTEKGNVVSIRGSTEIIKESEKFEGGSHNFIIKSSTSEK